MTIVLGVCLLFAVWSGPASYHPPSWRVAAQWLAWLAAIAALVFGIAVLEKGWPC